MALFDFSLPASDPNNPNGVTSASDIQRRQLLAQALMKQGTDYSPVQSPWQGAARLADAIMGGLQQDQLNRDQAAGTKDQNDQLGKIYGQYLGTSGASGSSSPSLSGLPSPGSSSPSSLPTFAGGADMAPFANAIGAVESKGSGDYSALGPKLDSGDRAYGRYQVMGANIPQWTLQALGKAMTPQEFLASPEAQDRVFSDQFGRSVQKFGNPQDAASVWFTGRPLAQAGGNASDGYSTNAQYQNKFNAALALQGNGSNGVQPSGATVQAPVQVASTDPNFAPGKPALSPGAVPMPGGGVAASLNPLTGAPIPGAGGVAPQASVPSQAISVPGYDGTFTRAQANDADGVPSQAEWDAAAAKSGSGSQVAGPGAPTGASSAPSAAAASVIAAPQQNQEQIKAAIAIIQNPYASPQAQQVASLVLQSAMKPKDSWQSFTRDGSYWQRNAQTGEEKLLQDNSPSDDAYSSVTLPNGQVESFNKRTGQFGQPSGAAGGYRPMTAQEKQAYGVPADQPAYVGPDGKPSGLGGGTTVNVGADSQSYDKQLAEGLGKAHAALANGVEDAQGRARDIAAMQGAVDAIQRSGGTTGFGAPQKLTLQKAINAGANALGIQEPYDVSDPEFMTKFNRAIAGQQAKGSMGSRVTNFEMSNYLKANPGLEMSTTGNQRLLGIQAQIEQRNVEVGNAIRNATAQAISSGQKINPVQVQKIITDYDAAHHIADPVTGQDLTQNPALSDLQTPQGANAAAAAVHQQNLGQSRPQPGAVQGGYRFKGGDPANKANWEKAQ